MFSENFKFLVVKIFSVSEKACFRYDVANETLRRLSRRWACMSDGTFTYIAAKPFSSTTVPALIIWTH